MLCFVVLDGGQSRGKALFARCAEKTENTEAGAENNAAGVVSSIPGVDFQVCARKNLFWLNEPILKGSTRGVFRGGWWQSGHPPPRFLRSIDPKTFKKGLKKIVKREKKKRKEKVEKRWKQKCIVPSKKFTCL